MQLLEQLASEAYSPVTGMDVMTECSALLGYLECMEENVLISDVLESSIVMEGFDPKAIFKKIWTFIKGTFTKIGQMINKLIGFIRGRKGKLKKKEVADAGGNNSNDDSRSSSSEDDFDDDFFDDDDSDDRSSSSTVARISMKSSSNGNKTGETKNNKGTGRPSSSTVARIGMKSKDELIEEVLKKHPYSGVHPNAINLSFQSIFTFSNSTLKRSLEFCSESIDIVEELSSGKISKDDDIRGDLEYLKGRLDRATKIDGRGNQRVLSYIADTDRKAGWDNLNDKIKSPQDFKNVPLLFYESYRKDSRVADYSNKIFDKNHFGFIVERYNSAVSNHSEYSELISKKLLENKNDVDKYIKKCDEMSKQLDKISNVDQEVLTKGFSAVTNLLNITSQCISYTIMGVPAFYSQVESDLNRLGAYIDTVNAELNTIR